MYGWLLEYIFILHVKLFEKSTFSAVFKVKMHYLKSMFTFLFSNTQENSVFYL